MIGAFLFDIGGVLLGFDFEPALERLRGSCDRPPEDSREQMDALKIEYECGRIGRRDFVRMGRELLGHHGGDAEFERIWQQIFFPNTPMHRLVERLSAQYPVFLLSNTNDLHLEHILAEYPVFRLFPKGVFSHLAGVMKPDPEIYRIAESELELDPLRPIFIDDLSQNIGAARQHGFQTHHYDMTSHEALIARLRELNVAPDLLQ